MGAALRLTPIGEARPAPRPRPRCESGAACEALLAKLRAEARTAGFEEGGQAALAETERREAALLAEISERLADAEMIRREARIAALADLEAALAAVVDALAPLARTETLVERLAAIVAEAADRDDGAAIVVRAPAATVAALARRLDPVRVVGAVDDLAPVGAARVEIGGGGVEVDMNRLCDAVRAEIAGLAAGGKGESRDAG